MVNNHCCFCILAQNTAWGIGGVVKHNAFLIEQPFNKFPETAKFNQLTLVQQNMESEMAISVN